MLNIVTNVKLGYMADSLALVEYCDNLAHTGLCILTQNMLALDVFYIILDKGFRNGVAVPFCYYMQVAIIYLKVTLAS